MKDTSGPDGRRTHVGDALVLRSRSSHITIFAVGPVVHDGQADFHRQETVDHMTDRAAAITAARALVGPRRRIWLRDLDTREWQDLGPLTGGVAVQCRTDGQNQHRLSSVNERKESGRVRTAAPADRT
jgi:hypothetical protein